MGISGLLPFLKDACSNVNIKDFQGCTVAVDTYCWIYRGAFSCAEELALGQPANGHVKYVLKYVHKLLEWGIKPVMIFDGSCLPSKKGTELKRKESKEMYKKKAAQCLLEGRRNEARECFQRCIECTPQMALEVIKALHEIGVDVLVAPYEADAQLAYMNKINIAQIIITEDSDLVLFGCEKIIYKLDMNGNGQLIEKSKIISITQFDSADNFERFRWMCILSGCDYLENLPGIGLGKAKKFLKSINKNDIEMLLKQMPKVLKMPSLIISKEYIEQFKKADKTFKHQIVFDPLMRKLVSLNPYDDSVVNEDLTYAGIFYDDNIALQHSLGNLHVNNREKVYDFNPDKWNYKPPLKYSNNPPGHMRSIWSKSYTTYSKSNLIASLFSNQKSNKTLINNMPNTTSITKTISTKVLVENNSSKNITNNNNKRKYDEINNEESKLDECDDVDEDDHDNDEKNSQKKTKMMITMNEANKCLTSKENDVVSQYFTMKSSQTNIDSNESSSSGYFSSSNNSIQSSSNSNRSTLTNKPGSDTDKCLDELSNLIDKKEETNLTSPIQIRKNTFTLINSPIIVENKNVKKSEKNSLLLDQLDDINDIKKNNSPKNNDLYEKFAVKSSNTFRKKISINSMFEEGDEEEVSNEVTSKPEIKFEIIDEKENTKTTILNSETKKANVTNFVSKSNKTTTTSINKKSNETTAALVKNNVKITDYLSKFKYTNSNKLTK